MKLHLVGLALLLFGCPPPPRPVERPYPPPRAEELLGALRGRSQRITSLRAETRTEYLEGGQRVKLSMRYLIARGGKLRFEADAPLQGTVLTLVSDGTTFQLNDARNNRFLEGPASPCNVARFLRVELSPEAIFEIFSGGVPLDGEPAQVSWDPSHGGREVLELKTPEGGSEKIWLASADRHWDVLEAERRDAAGQLLWTVEHEGFEDHDGVRLPKKTHLSQPTHHADAYLKLKSLELNVTPPDGVFHLAVPPNLPVQPTSC
jgi:hypothetical protein